MIVVVITLISLFADIVVSSTVIKKKFAVKNWLEHYHSSPLTFICLPQELSKSYIKAEILDDKLIHPTIVIQPPFYRIRSSAHILEFRSRKETNDRSSDNPQQPSQTIRDYKQIDGDDNGLYLPGESDQGMILFNNANQSAIPNTTEISSSTNITVKSSKRSRLSSSLRSLRPLIVPPWMLPLFSREDEITNRTNPSSSSALALSAFDEGATMTDMPMHSSNEPSTQSNSIIDAEIERTPMQSSDVQLSNKQQIENRGKRRRFFRRGRNRSSNTDKSTISREEATCPSIVSNVHELRKAVLVNRTALVDVGFRFPSCGIGSEVISQIGDNPTTKSETSLYIDQQLTIEQEETEPIKSESKFQRHDPVINGTLSSLFACEKGTTFNRNSTEYQHGIELLFNHPVLSLMKERAITNSTPGDRLPSDNSHLALAIEGGGMRGAVSAGMAAALSTLDLLDTFDSVHGSSAGAIIGAYLVSRQLCTDVYTDVMPAAGNQFASKRRSIINVGFDWLADLVSSSESTERIEQDNTDDEVCELIDEIPNDKIDEIASNASMWRCGDEVQFSSIELTMKDTTARADDSEGLLYESMNYFVSRTSSVAKRTISKPLSFGVKYVGRAFDLAASVSQYLRRKPGMNLTYILDGVMDETHGLRPFDIEAFAANDKRQPLYIIASAVSNGGSGEMETLAFNSKDGDYFGLSRDLSKDSKIYKDTDCSWYRRVWDVVIRTSSGLYSAVHDIVFAKEEERDTILPAGTNAIGGLVYNRKQIMTPKRKRDKFYEPTDRIIYDRLQQGQRKNGIFPCLEASMLVPGICNAPINLIRSSNRKYIEANRKFPRFLPRQGSPLLERQMKEYSHLCYDAFCYEPIPYRSAVEKADATHVLALRSRPDGCIVESKPHLYERVIGPIYFRKHGMQNVAKLFSSGGSQYRYIEDVLTLNEGLAHGIAMGKNESQYFHPQGVKVPPTKLFYGTEKTEELSMKEWRRAHLLPITMPVGTPELPTLSQDRDDVLKAVRHGYATAFDILAPIAGLPFDSKTIPGERVAELLFPDGDDDIVDVLNKPVKIKSSYIGIEENFVKELKKRERFAAWVTGKREARRKAQEEVALHPQGALAKRIQRRSSTYHESDQYVRDGSNTLEWLETEALLAALPGFQRGKLDHIANKLLASNTKDDRRKEK